MSLIPTYYCDHCGHAFSTPDTKVKVWRISYGRDEDDNDCMCPKCKNPDFELLTTENYGTQSLSHIGHAHNAS